MTKVITVIVLMLSMVYGWGQDLSVLQVQSKAMSYGDSIRILWLPGNANTWQKGMEEGYTLTRTTLAFDNRTLAFDQSAASTIILGHFKCLDSLSWMEVLDTSDQWEVLSAGMVYGTMEDFESSQSLDIDFYIDKEAERQNKYTFNLLGVTHSFRSAERMGLGFTDLRVESGASYQYNVSIGNSPGSTNQGIDIITQNIYKELPIISPFDAENNTLGILITWNIRYLKEDYISYDILRKREGSDEFQKVNISPVMASGDQNTMSFLDEKVDADVSYKYIIRGRTPFDRWGPPSDETLIKRTDAITFVTPIFKQLDNYGDKPSFNWHYPENEKGKIRGFNILFSPTYDGVFTLINDHIIPRGDTIYIPEISYPSGYFYIEAIGSTGQTTQSVKRLYNPEDITPPATPQSLECHLDTLNNNIEISWAPNMEADLLGYRLYYGSEQSGQYLDYGKGVMEVNRYSISLQKDGNGESLHFKIAAVDKRYNVSDLSDHCLVVLADKSPPASPLIRKVISGDSTILIEWATSPSWDVVAHRVERKTISSGNWVILDRITSPEGIQETIDTASTVGLKYQYRIIAIDASGNETPSEPRIGKLNIQNLKTAITQISARYEGERVELSWEYVESFLLDRIIIYRKVGEGNMVSYKILKGDILTSTCNRASCRYEDTRINSGVQYTYALRAIWKDGISTPMSKKVGVWALQE